MQKAKKKYSIAVLTATLNAAEYLPRLIESLELQTDQNFIWIVVDGLSLDATEEIIRDVKSLKINFIRDKDFGIYDALNRGIRIMTADYYLTVGADDILQKDAIKNYRKAIMENQGPDLVAAALKIGTKIYFPQKGWGWLYGMHGESSGHSVGLLIKRNMHQKFGFYSNKFPIAADQFFVKSSINKGARICRANFIAGEFSLKGTSGSDNISLLTDIFKVQLLTEKNATLQYCIFFVRLLKRMVISIFNSDKNKF